MAERGARPRVPVWRLRLLRLVRAFFTPLLPDDYLELINPLWSTRELRGRIEQIERETPDAATVWIRPGWEWPGHEPGQYLRVGIVVDGVHHWRAYSLTSAPGHPDGWISITPKLVEAGKVSPHLVRDARPGSIVRLGGVEGAFVLPARIPGKLLFISAGSGITPIASMLRSLRARDALADAVLLHSARTPQGVIFGAELRELARRHPGFRLHEQHTADRGRIAPEDLETLCPDWREREAFLSGPADMLDAMIAYWEREGDRARLHMERFQPVIGAARRATRRGRRDRLQCHRRDGGERRLHADLARRRTGGGDAAVWLPDGDLPYLCGAPVLRPGARSAHRQGVGAARRDGAHLHQRPGR